MNQDDLSEKINDILFDSWDPIGINDIAPTNLEYAMYAEPIKELLLTNSNLSDISKYLEYIRTERMELPKNHDSDMDAASLLLGLMAK